MTLLNTLQDRLLSALAILGAVAILALMVHVGLDITLRNVANAPIPATYEIVSHYYMAALAFIPLAWVERSGGMVQVEVLEGVMGPRLVALSDRIVALISTVIYGALAWVTFEVALRNTGTGTFVMAQSTRVPTWPAFWLPPLGFGLAALVTAIRLVTPRRAAQQGLPT
jgi:TRAP-type C4-dicarboxylate transport system permease small subunit